jgi:hypothetical protein
MIEQQRAFMGHGLKDVSANAKRHSDSLDGFGRDGLHRVSAAITECFDSAGGL